MHVAAAYLGVILIWSTTPLAIKFSAESLSFISAVGLRMALAAGICVVLLALLRRRLRLDRAALAAYAAANLGVFGAMSLVYLSTAYIPSGLISVIFGLAPLLSGVMARPLLDEPPLSGRRIGALLLALAGLALVFRGEISLQANPVPGLVSCLLAVTLFALSGVLVKRLGAGLRALEHTTGSLLLSLPLFAVAWWWLDGELPAGASPLSIGAVVYLAIMGSVVGFMLYFFVLQHLRATQVALIPLLTPVIALSLGVTLAGETVAAGTLGGGALILFALALYQFDGLAARRWWRRARGDRLPASVSTEAAAPRCTAAPPERH